ncbi:MAG TPA: AsmA-like C-terminal region-containing protein [Bacteroidales bacterium]|nr:AsmA-like C-terminal region-containing protein [Bacteroidales bacterium]
MKLLLKILKITSILIFSVLIVLFSASLILQDEVADYVMKALDLNFQTKLETESYRLSLIKRFPRASVEMKNVLVHSSPGFDRSAFGEINTDTLLSAKSASFVCKMINILRGDYTFTRINIRSGNLNLFTDTAGRINYEFSKEKGDKTGEEEVTLNLKRVNLSDVRVVYNDLNADLVIKSKIGNSRIRSRISDDKIEFDGNSDMVFEFFRLGGFAIRQNIPALLEVGLNKNVKGIFFKKSTLSVDNWDIILTGFIASDNYLDLNVSGKNIDISKITDLLPEKYRKTASEYHPSGILEIDSKIKGVSSRTNNPHYEISWSLNNAHIDYNKSDLKIDKFSFDGSYSNGEKNRPETSSFTIRNFITKLGSSEYKGGFTISDFSKPKVELTFDGILFPAELKEFLNLRNVERADGSIDMKIRLSGYLEKKDRYKLADLLDLNSRSEMVFNSFGIKLNNKQIDLKDAGGKILFNESTVSDNFQFVFNDQKINLDGKLNNLPEWLAGKPVNLTGSVSVTSSSIRPELFFNTSSEPEENKATRSSVTFPDDIVLDLEFNIDTLIYKTFKAEELRGTISYKPKLLIIRTINLNSQKGTISGNGLIVQDANKSFISRGSFALKEIDIKEAFTTFHNFGQDFLKAENIAGSLSGTLSLLLPLDSLGNPITKSTTAEGTYIIVNGELNNFEPVKQLSSFIELSELENIKFDQLENDFFIRDNFLYIPQMDIKSSAADLSVNGKHSFENYYEYHVKMLLSEILSKKARKNRNVVTEFGVVEDDGLGRMSLLLKIENKGDDVKVSYDLKAAGSQIRNDIKKEREALKTIFNQEYGSARYDPSRDDKTTGKPRFSITWEGSDTTKTVMEPEEIRKKNILRNLFRKK